MSPFNAWTLLKGIETLPLRVKQQTANAGKIADFLADSGKVAKVIYPGRADHPQADIIARQMSGGSTLVAFELKGGKEAAFKLQNALEIVKISNNLGDAKSLITHPGTTTHKNLTDEARAELGISGGTLRLSCGIEDTDDLLERSGEGSGGRFGLKIQSANRHGLTACRAMVRLHGLKRPHQATNIYLYRYP